MKLMGKPPIPARCVDRPMVGGLVVPFVSVVAAGRPVLGSVHGTKATRCIFDRLCQVCGQPLGHKFVVLVTSGQLAEMFTSEAPLHPECARYSTAACPMVAGTLDTYRSIDRHIGTACDQQGCDCDGWVPAATNRDPEARRNMQAQDWHAVWLTDYAATVNTDGHPNGLTWRGYPVIRVRPVTHASDPHPEES